MRVSDINSQPRIVWSGYSCSRTASARSTPSGNACCCLLVALLTILVPGAAAQRAASAHAVAPHSAIPHFNSPAGNFAFGRVAYPSRFHQPFPYTSLPFPFFGDSFYLDDIYSSGYPVASQPPVILLQAARALAGPAGYADNDYANNEPSIPQPLMIELQNGRYVRLNRTPSNGEALPLTLAPARAQSDQAQPSKSTRSSSTRPTIAAAAPPHDLPPALLVFRDGHSEEVRDYTIADGILYARGDYYTDGYWNKKIALSTLNVSQTLEANATRQVKFILPASLNEVITRP